MAKRTNATEVTYEIVDELGVIATYATGWRKELNIIRWNPGNDSDGNITKSRAKFDIRDWSDDSHSRMSRGITLTEQEMASLVDLYQGYQLARAAELE